MENPTGKNPKGQKKNSWSSFLEKNSVNQKFSEKNIPGVENYNGEKSSRLGKKLL